MKKLLTYMRTFEPARLRAIYTALVVLLATVGVAVPAGVDHRVTGFLGALAVIVPLIQGEFTRAGVKPARAPEHTDNMPEAADGPQIESQDPSVVVEDEA